MLLINIQRKQHLFFIFIFVLPADLFMFSRLGSAVTTHHLNLIFLTVPQLSLQYPQLHHHFNAQIQEQLHPQLPECVSNRAAHGHAGQHHQGCGQGCQRYV